MLSPDSEEPGGPAAVDGEIGSVCSSNQVQGQSMAMKCADSLPNLSSNVIGRGLISPSLEATPEAQTSALASPQASVSAGDARKSDYYAASSLSAHGSPRYGSNNFYRGSGAHAYNGVNDFGSKRSHRTPVTQPSGNANRHNVSSFSPQTVASGSGFGYGQHGNRSSRDSASGDGRVTARRMGRSATTDDVHGGSNHAVVDGKFVRILQRPLPLSGRTVGEDGNVDDGDSDKSSPEALQLQQQQLKRAGHRKKTLSLNPEEREALENLVEEVIIGGLGEAIIDSDGTSSDDNDDDNDISNHTQSESNRGNRVEPTRRTDHGKRGDRPFEYNRDNRATEPKTGVKDNAGNGERNYSPKSDGKNSGRNNSRDFNRRNRDNAGSNANVRGKDVKRDFNRQSKDGSPEEEKEKPNAATVRGVNIYPAQLKVAIKHMDSLPPRFLRRLQTGSNRTAGNESIIARLTMKSPTAGQGIADDASTVSSPTDRDRGKSKQTQLQETKKTIRNLLCDLDQYTDETVTSKDECGHHSNISEGIPTADLVFSAAQDVGYTGSINSPPAVQMVRPQQPFYVGQQQLGMDQQFVGAAPGIHGVRPPPAGQVFGQSLQMFGGRPQAPLMISCEELERELLASGKVATSIAHAAVEGTVNKANSVQLPASSQFYAHQLPQADGAFLSYELQQQQSVGTSAIQSSPVISKKTQFSVDAPEFVSGLFVMNRSVAQTGVGGPGGEPFYTVPHASNNAEMSVQLTDNVHLPTKPPHRQYPMVVVSSANVTPQSSAMAPDYDITVGSSATQQSQYQMVPYEQMNSPNLGIMRNTPSYMVPMSVPLAPSAATCSGDAASSSVVDMNVLPYQQYQYVSGTSGFNAGYAQPVQDFQNSASEFSQPPPSFMTAPICGADSMSQQWLADPASQQQPWYTGYTNMSYENSTTFGSSPQSNFDEMVYGSSPVMPGYPPQQVMNPGAGLSQVGLFVISKFGLDQLWMGRIKARVKSVQRSSLLRVSAASRVRGVRGGRQSGLQRQRRPATRFP
jgi:hypothetical protein